MNNQTTTTKSVPVSTNTLLKAILNEIHLLRHDIEMAFSQEDIEDYAHPERIKHSYKEALKQYPVQL